MKIKKIMHGKYIIQGCSNFNYLKRLQKKCSICIHIILGTLYNQKGNEGRKYNEYLEKQKKNK